MEQAIKPQEGFIRGIFVEYSSVLVCSLLCNREKFNRFVMEPNMELVSFNVNNVSVKIKTNIVNQIYAIFSIFTII